MHLTAPKSDIAIDIALALGTIGAVFIFGVCALPLIQIY